MPVGCGISFCDLTNYRQELFMLPLLELEDYLRPEFAEHNKATVADSVKWIVGCLPIR